MSSFIALGLLAHAVVHAVAIDPTRPSFVLNDLGLEGVAANAVACTLVGATLVGFVLAAGSITGVVVPRSWARTLVLASSGVSALVLVLFAGPWLVPGLAIDAVLASVAVGAPRWLAGSHVGRLASR